MKKKILGIGSIALASIALFLMLDLPYGLPIGDLILEKLGLNAWSNGGSGFHMAIIYYMPFIALGYIGMEQLYQQYPKIYRRKTWIVLGVTAVLVVGSSKCIEFSKSMQPGLKSIQFLYDKSSFKYEYEGEKILSASGDLEFKNYSKTSRNFYVKYITDDEFSNQFGVKELVGYEIGTENPKLIQVAPKSTCKIQVDFNKNMKLDTGDDGSSSSGSRSIETVIIYNDQEQVEFTGDNFMGITVVD